MRDEFDDFERFPNSWNFGVYIDGLLASSLRIHYLTPECPKSPANSLFADVLAPLLAAGATFVDPTRFTVDFEASLAYPALPFLTLRLAVMATRHFSATYGLHCVRPEHGPFYKRVLGSHLMCAARRWHDVGFPMELWGTRAQEVYERTLRLPVLQLLGGRAPAAVRAAACDADLGACPSDARGRNQRLRAGRGAGCEKQWGCGINLLACATICRDLQRRAPRVPGRRGRVGDKA